MPDQSASALSRGDSPDYIGAILKFLGDREPLEVFAATDTHLREATKDLSGTHLRQPEKPGKWSILQVVQHLADAEIMLGLRYRKVLAEPGQPYPAIDQDAWVKELGYNERNLDDALDDFAALRKINLRLLRDLTDEQWQRHGIHEQRGKETLKDMVRLYAAHDCYHLYQIDRIKTAIGVISLNGGLEKRRTPRD